MKEELIKKFYYEMSCVLKEKREELRYILEEVAIMLDVTPSCISNYENNIRRVPLVYYVALLDLYGLPRRRMMYALKIYKQIKKEKGSKE